MKKIITVCTLIMALCLTSVTAFAAEIDETTPSNETAVYYKIGNVTNPNDPDDPTDDEVAGTYKVTIPDYIEAVEMDQIPVTQKVTAEEVMIPYNSELSVGIAYDGELKLKDNSDITVGYKIISDDSDVSTGDTILTIPAGTPDAVTTTESGGILTEMPVYSGMYVNTATFTLSVL